MENWEVERTLEQVTGDGVIVIPVIQEELAIDRQKVTTGTVRVQKLVHQREELVEESIRESKFEIERIPIDRVVETAPPIRQEGETTIYPVIEEVLVITRKLVLREEVRITNRVSELPRRQSFILRTEELVVKILGQLLHKRNICRFEDGVRSNVQVVHCQCAN